MGMREGAGIYLKVHNSLGPASCQILKTLTLNFCIPEQGKQYQNNGVRFRPPARRTGGCDVGCACGAEYCLALIGPGWHHCTGCERRAHLLCTSLFIARKVGVSAEVGRCVPV